MSSSELRNQVLRLTGDRRVFEPLKAQPVKGARPGEVSTGRPSSGGSAQPLTLAESDFTLREYWPAVEVESTDGIFTLEIEPIRQVTLEGGGAITFREPV